MSKNLRQTSLTSDPAQQNANSNGLRNTQITPIAATNEHQRLTALVAQGDYIQAIQFLHSSGKSSSAQHDTAVCLMRLGRFAEAVDILRKLVLNHDCVWMRKDIPLVYKTNFVTALLLGGHPAGCRSLLGELNDETIPAVIKVQAIINDWEKSMTLWQRLNWRWMGIEPANKPVLFDGVAGDFETVLVDRSPIRSLELTSPSLKIAT